MDTQLNQDQLASFVIGVVDVMNGREKYSNSLVHVKSKEHYKAGVEAAKRNTYFYPF